MLSHSYPIWLKVPAITVIVLIGAYVYHQILVLPGDVTQPLNLMMGLAVVSVVGLVILSRPLLGLVAIVATLPLQAVWANLNLPFVSSLPLITSLNVPLGLFTLVATVLQIKQGKLAPIRWRAEHLLGLLFVVWIFVSNPNAAMAGIGERIWMWTFVQLWILLVLGSVLLRNPRSSITLAVVFVLALVASVAAGWVVTDFDLSRPASFAQRLGGLQGQSSGLALLSVVALFWTYILRSHLSRAWYRAVFLVAIPFALAGIVFSLSRRGVLTLLFLGLLLFWMRSAQNKRSVMRYLLVGLIAVSVIAIVASTPGNYLNFLFNSIYTEAKEGTGTTAVRLELWRIAGQVWLENPIKGMGIGTFYQRIPGLWSLSRGYHNFAVHNSFLSVLTETGIIGFILFVSLQVIVFRRLWRAVRIERAGGLWCDVSVMWLLVLAAWSFAGLFGSLHYGKMLWIAAGAASALSTWSPGLTHVSENDHRDRLHREADPQAG